MFSRHREYSSEDAIRDSAWNPRPISLDDLVESADLQVRMDRKYFVPAATFRTLIDELGPEFKVLEIDGQRTFDYESVYFDTPELLPTARTYRDAGGGSKSAPAPTSTAGCACSRSRPRVPGRTPSRTASSTPSPVAERSPSRRTRS